MWLLGATGSGFGSGGAGFGARSETWSVAEQEMQVVAPDRVSKTVYSSQRGQVPSVSMSRFSFSGSGWAVSHHFQSSFDSLMQEVILHWHV